MPGKMPQVDWNLKGAIIFYWEAGAVCLWGGTRIFWSGQRGGPVFSVGQKFFVPLAQFLKTNVIDNKGAIIFYTEGARIFGGIHTSHFGLDMEQS